MADDPDVTSRSGRRAFVEKIEMDAKLLPRSERRHARTKAFDESGVADTPSFRRFENQVLAVLLLVVAGAGVWLASAATTTRQVSAVILGLLAMAGIGFIFCQRTLDRKRRRKTNAESPGEPF